MTKRLVILNAWRERIRNTLERETDFHSHLHGFAMTDKQKFIRTPYVFVATKPLVILSAWRERIRIPIERETDCHSRLHGFAMTKAEERIAALALLARNDKWDESRKVNCNDG